MALRVLKRSSQVYFLCRSKIYPRITFMDLWIVNRSCSSINKSIFAPQMKLEQLNVAKLNDVLKLVSALKTTKEHIRQDFLDPFFSICNRAVELEIQPLASTVEDILQMCTSNDNIKLDGSHMISLLKLCTEANVKIDFETFYGSLGEHNFDLNLFEHLAINLSEAEDDEALSKICTLMNKKGIPFSEIIYSCLILSKGLNRDMSGVISTFQQINQSSIELTNISYLALFRAYICNGYMDELKDVMKTFKLASNNLNSSEYSKALLDAAKHWKATEVPSIYNYILNSRVDIGAPISYEKLAKKFIHRGLAIQALSLIKLADNKSNEAYIEDLIKYTEQDTKSIIEFCKEFEKSGWNDNAFEVALRIALLERKENASLSILQHLHDTNTEIRNHYFWPLFAASGSSYQKVLDILEVMVKMGISVSFETLKTYVIPRLPLDDPQLTLHLLSNRGISKDKAITPLISVLIQKRNIEQATVAIRDAKISLLVIELIETLAYSWPNNPEAIVEVFLEILEKNERPQLDWCGYFLLLIAYIHKNINVCEFQKVVKKFEKNNLKISEFAINILSRIHDGSLKASVENYDLVDSMLASPSRESVFIHPNEMSVELLESHLAELRSKDMNTRGVLRRLLLKYSQQKDKKKFESILKEFNEVHQNTTPGMLSSQMKTYTENKDPDGAIEVLIYLCSNFPRFRIDSYKIIDLCCLLVSLERKDDAFSVLEIYTPPPNHKGDYIKRNCHALLSECKKVYDFETTQKFCTFLIEKKIIQPVSMLLGVPIQAKLLDGDLAGAVHLAAENYKMFKVLSCRREILGHLIKADEVGSVDSDGKNLKMLTEQMFDLCDSASGRSSAQISVFMASLEVGRLDKATTYAQDLQFSAYFKLYKECDFLLKREDEQTLLSFLETSKHLRYFDRMQICRTLLNLYCIRHSGEGALDLVSFMEAERIEMTSEFSKPLNRLLKSCNLPTPSKS